MYPIPSVLELATNQSKEAGTLASTVSVKYVVAREVLVEKL